MITFSQESKPAMIVDAGSRHYGLSCRAVELIDAACVAGADAILFDAHDNKQGLTKEDWYLISCLCAERGLPFGATCWEPASVKMLSEVRYKPSFYKVADTATNKVELIHLLDTLGITILLSTGMSSMVMVDEALRAIKKTGVVLLHSTNIYPCPFDKINLSAIKTLVRRYGIPVGYSSHEVGHHVTVAAIGAGAVFIEKGFMLGDDKDPKEAHEYALGPEDLGTLIKCIEHLYPAIGDGAKTIYAEEMDCTEMVIVE